MQQLDAQTLDELQAIYADAADQVRAAIRAQVDASDTVPVSNLRRLLAQIGDVIDALGQERDALLMQGLEQAAVLGTQPFTMAGVGATGIAGQAVLTSDAAMVINQAAVRFVQSFTAADGLKLSDRLWRLDQGAKEVLSRSIGQAVVSGWDATRAAREFMFNAQAIAQDVSTRLYAAKADSLTRAADLLIGDRSELWKADRVFRTEINRAHGTAYMESAAKTPGFAGFKFLLSPLHPKPDICDLLAAQNLYGLGPGVYPTAKETPWPAHPNTLSFVNMVFAENVTEADQAGKETVTDAMGRMPADVREGILGVGKSELNDAGQLKAWQFRSPLAAVKQRLARQGQE